MGIRRQIGVISIYPRYGGGSYGAHPSEFDAIKEAWMAGKSFIETRNLYGDRLIIKLAAVEAIQLSTPLGMARGDDDEDEERQSDMVHGND